MGWVTPRVLQFRLLCVLRLPLSRRPVNVGRHTTPFGLLHERFCETTAMRPTSTTTQHQQERRHSQAPLRSKGAIIQHHPLWAQFEPVAFDTAALHWDPCPTTPARCVPVAIVSLTNASCSSEAISNSPSAIEVSITPTIRMKLRVAHGALMNVTHCQSARG